MVLSFRMVALGVTDAAVDDGGITWGRGACQDGYLQGGSYHEHPHATVLSSVDRPFELPPSFKPQYQSSWTGIDRIERLETVRLNVSTNNQHELSHIPYHPSKMRRACRSGKAVPTKPARSSIFPFFIPSFSSIRPCRVTYAASIMKYSTEYATGNRERRRAVDWPEFERPTSPAFSILTTGNIIIHVI